MPNFKLVNPMIEGSFNNSFTASSALDGAKKAWESLSQYIVNDLPRFGLTLQDGGSNKLHHFMLNEKASSNSGKNKASFDLTPLSVSKGNEKKFLERIGKVEQQFNSHKGGKHKKSSKNKDDDDDSSSSSDSSSNSDSDLYDRVKLFKQSQYNYQPINYWWYSPLIYKKEQEDAKKAAYLNSFYVPQFIYPYVPYVEIDILDLSSAWF